ncbi:MAG: hypothetical protein L0I76_00680 [Pseudonocardia sp.]|nr:hypothetical protein [Pseudonocardia sp.]
MASTEKVSLSLDVGSLVLARRAAELEQTNLSAYISRLVHRHAWESERPTLTSEQQARADADLAALDEREEHGRGAGGQRATG